MIETESTAPRLHKFDWSALFELLKPITWFPPMWAFACGVVSSGVSPLEQPLIVVLGILLAGPMVCGASQVVNDWFDRHVDAINEPGRPIPSGRVPGRRALYFAILWSLLSLALGIWLGPWVAAATVLGLILAWAYSAPPLRLKLNGWWGNAAVGFSYEGLAWVTGAAVMIGGGMPDYRVFWLAILYSIGAHGIMTLNDFKAIEGDRQLGIRTLPVQLGVERAIRLACLTMVMPQIIVIGLLFHWGQPWHAATIVVFVLMQLAAMVKLLRQPREMAPWYNGTGVLLSVLGMMVSAFAIAP